MKGIIYAIIISMGVYSPVSYGSTCSKPVSPIKQGDVATCDGFIFSKEAENEAYKATKLVPLLEEENKILEKRINLYIKSNDELLKYVDRKESTETLIRGLYFISGVLITGYIAANIK